MARKQHSIEINGDRFLITSMPATTGLTHLKMLTKLLGPALAEAGAGSKEGAGSLDIATLVGKVITRIDEVEVEKMIIGMMTSVSKNNMEINFNEEFSADFGKLFQLVTEVVKLNFGSVFQALGFDGQQ
ncbi:hypothetical protein [Pseudomonas phage vB_PaeM_PAO1_Ab17]|uniref:Uncharacterized protein n=2 Tax=Nankokuvirus Ab03 TaxID=1925780 RepID=A0A0A1IVP6_9CAUD|nr:tail assembly chaperone [Pseudomonas phage vB_PaeM_PAO1_Ab03]CEF89176.1 hypothetical protein [Pseudomonas phage vB_PaeM_PAO1_Ab03]CEF89560.1 hypothetical protein [Pseudomonas phage vB_PaeM_PAO1_Ab17]